MRSALLSFVLLFMVVLLYFLSYAPVYRFRYGTDQASTLGEGSLNGIYQPVYWAIDHTILRESLLAWARIWGVGQKQEIDSTFRQLTILIRSHGTWHTGPRLSGPAYCGGSFLFSTGDKK